jgi:ribosome modulation factor
METTVERDREAEFRSQEQRAGYLSGIDGARQDENPWATNTREAIDWHDGWMWAESIRESWLDLHD